MDHGRLISVTEEGVRSRRFCSHCSTPWAAVVHPADACATRGARSGSRWDGGVDTAAGMLFVELGSAAPHATLGAVLEAEQRGG
jgi:hypothetical protein